jgi:hypothetical protein
MLVMPVCFLNFDKTKKSNIGPATVLYVPNTDNQIFRLNTDIKIGTLNDLKQSLVPNTFVF